MEYWMASIAVAGGKNSFTATSLFSFFLSKSLLRNHLFPFLLKHTSYNLKQKKIREKNRKIWKGYNLRRSALFLSNDEVQAGWCLCSGDTLDHQHIRQWSCHLSLPISVKRKSIQYVSNYNQIEETSFH